MADSTVAALSAASALDGTELYYGVQGGTNKKVTGAQIKTLTSASPTLVTPDLGTPSAGTLTNCTLPVGGVSGLGTGVGTFLVTPSSANLLAAVTDETGTGSLVFATSPTFITPILGTPTSGTLTNCTLPVGGVSGLGTGIATFLATPSSANLLAAVTDETGTGALVFSASPSLSGTLTLTNSTVILWSGRTRIDDPADAQLRFKNSAQTVLTNISFPASSALTIGAVANAAPAAGTFNVGESSRGGTDSNVAGASGTVASGNGTGTGTVSTLIFQTPTVAASGATQQTLATRLTLSSAGVIIASGLVFQIGNAATTGLTAGVLAATTNSTIVITDSTGQAYRIPCII